MCFKDLRRNLTSSAEKRVKVRSSPSTRTSTGSSTRSSSPYSSSSSRPPSPPIRDPSSRSPERQATPAPREGRRGGGRGESGVIDGVFLKRDSDGRNWFHGPGGLVKQQIGWKMPINRIDPEINHNTSHGRRSQLAVVNEDRSLSRVEDRSTGPEDTNPTHRKRHQIRRVSTIGSITDVTGLDNMSIDSITSVEAAVGKVVSLSDSDDTYLETKNRIFDQKKGSKLPQKPPNQ